MIARPWWMRAAGAMLLLCACRSEFVVGLLADSTTAGDGSSTDDTAGTELDGADDLATTTTTATTATTTAGTTEGSTGPSCAETTTSEMPSSTSGDEPLPECMAPMGHTVCDSLDDDPFHALGLGCAGTPAETTPIANALLTGEPTTVRVGTRYGADDNQHFVPTEGSKVLVLSTGTLDVVETRIEVPLGRTYADDGDNPNPDGPLPAPIDPASGLEGECAAPFFDCDGVGDCSDTLPELWAGANGLAHDLVWLRFDVDVPFGTFGYRVDLAWFSAEFPEDHAEVASDALVWWQTSEAFTGNAATLAGAPLTVRGVGEAIASTGFVGNANELLGTGYESTEVAGCSAPWGDYPAGQCPNGGSTGWMTLAGRVHPGETMTTVVALFDVGDAHVDSAALLDHWRWDCAGCELGATCGLGPLRSDG